MADPIKASEGFPPWLRLRRTADYRRVQRRGRRHHRELLVTLHASNGLDHPRFGLTVSRKVGNAVVRNRVKRRLRDAIRRHPASRDGSLSGIDVVFIARSRAAEATGHDLRDAVGEALAAVIHQRGAYAAPSGA